ncbi:BON domain-containing protein [Chitinivorax sp. B]|uniref:BON domain-containing protein n=1 Tax=Chitinivorax sp. B TaxID=2502235 RepID=UPI0010F6FC43|nr:BON domain-containing protein [Chitinivorax sp. B]
MKSNLHLLRTIAILISLGGAVSLTAGCGSTPKQESTGEYIDDTAITAKVKAEFVADKTVSAAAINVETFKGVVQLSGFAISAAEVDRAVMLARNVKGVKSVKNDIRMK